MKYNTLFLVVTALLTLTNHCVAEENSPKDILEKVEAFYKTLETYQSEGIISSEFEVDEEKTKIETTVSIRLKKPNLYLITWEQKNMPMPGMSSAGAVWSDGDQPYLYMSMMNAYSKITGDEMALGAATGLSSGAAFNVPSLFLPVSTDLDSPLTRLQNLQLEPSEKVANEDCYVLSGSSDVSVKETLWISKKNFAIRKFYQSLEAPEGGRQVPEMTDEDLEETLKAMGREVSDEAKRELKSMMEESMAALEGMEMKGHITEVHEKISFPELDQEDFTFELPAGTQLRDSLFDNQFEMPEHFHGEP